MPPETPVASEQYFDGNTISPQFRVALLNFLQANSSASGKIKSGVGSMSISASNSSTLQAIAHGLGKTPSFLRIYASFGNALFSDGDYDGTAIHCIRGYSTITYSSTQMIDIEDAGGNGQIADVTMDATNINLSWTKVGSLSGLDIYFLWEVQ